MNYSLTGVTSSLNNIKRNFFILVSSLISSRTDVNSDSFSGESLTNKIKMQYLEFANGDKIPMIGLGTWRAPDEEVEAAINLALEIGYRHFDCAPVYM